MNATAWDPLARAERISLRAFLIWGQVLIISFAPAPGVVVPVPSP